jgi:hypothetical protein
MALCVSMSVSASASASVACLLCLHGVCVAAWWPALAVMAIRCARLHTCACDAMRRGSICLAGQLFCCRLHAGTCTVCLPAGRVYCGCNMCLLVKSALAFVLVQSVYSVLCLCVMPVCYACVLCLCVMVCALHAVRPFCCARGYSYSACLPSFASPGVCEACVPSYIAATFVIEHHTSTCCAATMCIIVTIPGLS